MDELPSGWVSTAIGQIAEIKTGKTPPKSRPELFTGSIPFIKPGDLEEAVEIESATDTVTEKGAELAGRLPPGTVLVTCIGNLGKVGLVTREACCNQQINAILPTEVALPKYLFYWAKQIKGWLEDNASATTVTIINKGRFAKAPIILPPAPEQRRIIKKLDRLMARSGRAREELERIPRLVERYKQAVMAAAFSGELTEDWRREKEILDASPWPIPSSWMWKRIEDVSEIASNLVDPKEVLDFPHIAPNHIESGIPKLLPYKTVREDEIISPKNRFFPGQIVYSKIRPYLRKAVLVDFDGVCSADMYPIWPKIHPRYLLYWLISPAFNDISMEHQGRTVLPKINQKALYSLPIPVPPAEEQIEIASRIDQAFTLVDRVMAETRKSLGLLIQLEQQTFDKAFRGELVPQDPNDEPASVLLKRIQNARKEEINGRQKGRARRENSRSLFE